MKYSKAYDFYYADREDYKKKKNENLGNLEYKIQKRIESIIRNGEQTIRIK